jgi:hypothetical protein
VALSILLQRLREPRLATWRPLPPGDALILHGVRHLPLRFRPAQRAGTPHTELRPATANS